MNDVVMPKLQSLMQAHLALVELEEFYAVHIITQNVDDYMSEQEVLTYSITW